MELSWTGRVLDAAGAPISGEKDLTVRLFDGEGAGASELFEETFPDVPVESGYAQVLLGGGATPLDGRVLSQPQVWVELEVDGSVMGPRQRLASTPYAHLAARIPVTSTPATGPCTDTGLVAWDTSINGLRVCDGTRWVSTAVKTIVMNGSSRNWSDGTWARSCKEYRFPTNPMYEYSGATANVGTYAIDPDGDGSNPVNVTCDMVTDGGGYTFFPVNGGTSTCGAFQANSCPAGMDIVMPRTQAHWTFMVSQFGASYFEIVPGIYNPNGGRSYTTCAMRDPASYGSGCADWRVKDGGKWWLRDTAFTEPNNDYTANCWLGITDASYAITTTTIANGQGFNDGGCTYCASTYLCSTNDK
jgi:hypothetical protein